MRESPAQSQAEFPIRNCQDSGVGAALAWIEPLSGYDRFTTQYIPAKRYGKLLAPESTPEDVDRGWGEEKGEYEIKEKSAPMLLIRSVRQEPRLAHALVSVP